MTCYDGILVNDGEESGGYDEECLCTWLLVYQFFLLKLWSIAISAGIMFVEYLNCKFAISPSSDWSPKKTHDIDMNLQKPNRELMTMLFTILLLVVYSRIFLWNHLFSYNIILL